MPIVMRCVWVGNPYCYHIPHHSTQCRSCYFPDDIIYGIMCGLAANDHLSYYNNTQAFLVLSQP